MKKLYQEKLDLGPESLLSNVSAAAAEGEIQRADLPKVRLRGATDGTQGTDNARKGENCHPNYLRVVANSARGCVETTSFLPKDLGRRRPADRQGAKGSRKDLENESAKG